MQQSEFIFAYGSNMDPSQMRERCPESDLSWFIAEARGYRLCFPRKSAKRRGGVGSIVVDDAQSVWGVVFSVTRRDLERLDGFEGVGSGAYQKQEITVNDAKGNPHTVWAYIAKPQGDGVTEYLPSKDYIRLYINGAEYFGLPANYRAKLQEIKTNEQEL